MDLLDHVAARIRDLRVNYNNGEGLSQESLATHLKVAPNTISRWETGTYRPGLKDMERLSRFFGVSIISGGMNAIIETPKNRAIRSTSVTLGQYVPVSHLEMVLGATFNCFASASWESPSPLL